MIHRQPRVFRRGLASALWPDCRYVFPDGTFLLVARGVDSCAIVRDDLDRQRWMALLAETVRRWRWHVHAFVLMDTHYHVVAGARRVELSDGMHRLNGLHAQRFNRRHSRTGTCSGTASPRG